MPDEIGPQNWKPAFGNLLPLVRRNSVKMAAELAPLFKLSWEVRGSDDKPLLHIWSEQYNGLLPVPITQTPGWFWSWNALDVLAPFAWSLYASSSSGPRGNCRAKNFAIV
jgi:hypothetical protein